MAETLYALTEADVQFLRTLRTKFAGGMFQAPTPRVRQRKDRNYARVPFRNDASETIPAYACMRVTGVATVNSRPFITVAKPNTSFNRLYLVNGPFEVTTSNKYGYGTWLWHADEVLYDDASTPAVGESWGPQDAAWTIKKWRYGFTIMAGNQTSPKRTTAVQHVVNSFWGQTDAAINKGSNGTISVYDGNASDTSINVTSVENKFANVAISKKVGVTWWGGDWFLTSAEC